MSLFWQLRLTILLITLISFTGSLVIGLFASQGYLEQQLHRKNIDSADSLAYSISHLNKDPAIIDVQVAALFDSGQYERIAVSSLEGVVISERTQEAEETGIPDWFVGLYPISVQPATAQISDAWMHYGMVSVAGNTRFGNQVLWDLQGFSLRCVGKPLFPLPGIPGRGLGRGGERRGSASPR